MLILDKFFLKYKGGQIDPPEKTTLKKPSLIKVKDLKVVRNNLKSDKNPWMILYQRVCKEVEGFQASI